MKRICFSIVTIIIALTTNISKAETGVASFDFTANSWGFPVCSSLSDISSYYISPETKIQNNGITITLAPSPYKISSKYIANWRSDINALYYNTYSHFIIKTNVSDAVISNVEIRFADGQNGGRGYFFDTWQNSRKDLNNKYTLSNDLGTLDLNGESFSEIHWLMNQNDGAKLQIKEIIITYNSITSTINNISTDFTINTINGGIIVDGNPNDICIYNISGAMISHGKKEIICPSGIYIVKVDGKARKVIVK